MPVNRLRNIDEIVTQSGTVVDLENIQASGSGATVIGSSVRYSKSGNVEYFDFAEPQQPPSKINSATDLQLIATGVQKLVLVDIRNRCTG